MPLNRARITGSILVTLLTLTACTGTAETAATSESTTNTLTPRDNQDITRVTKIIDGNTLTAQHGDTTLHIRLINTHAPTPEADNPDATCLAQEATDQLATLLPIGTPITLTYDPNLTSPEPGDSTPDNPIYAGVTVTGGKLINAEITRTGHTTATQHNSTLHHTDVQQAQAEAEQNQAGLYSRTHDCTLPAQLAAATHKLNEATGTDLKEPLETAATLPKKIADYANTTHPHLTTIATSQTVTTLTETLNRTATSKRGAYTNAQQAEEEKKQQERDNPSAEPTTPAETQHPSAQPDTTPTP